MSFTTVPIVPTGVNLSEAETRFLSALKQNVELITNQRGDGQFAAITVGQLGVSTAAAMTLQQITATGAYVTISGSDVVLVSDYRKLLSDFALLANDVSEIRGKLNLLITQLKGA